jgi:hypothetical protein
MFLKVPVNGLDYVVLVNNRFLRVQRDDPVADPSLGCIRYGRLVLQVHVGHHVMIFDVHLADIPESTSLPNPVLELSLVLLLEDYVEPGDILGLCVMQPLDEEHLLFGVELKHLALPQRTWPSIIINPVGLSIAPQVRRVSQSIDQEFGILLVPHWVE